MEKRKIRHQVRKGVILLSLLLFAHSHSVYADSYFNADATVIENDGTVKQIPMRFYVDNDGICQVAANDLIAERPCIDRTQRGLLIIPEKVNGYTVTRIGPRAFMNSYIDNVRIPKTVDYIAIEAFKYCGIEKISLSENVKFLDIYSFESCANMKTARIDCDLTEIKGGVFRDCLELETVVLGEHLRGIGKDWFNGCVSLESIYIPDNIEVIGSNAFSGCKDLKEVRLPAHLKAIEHHCFSDCRNITSIVIPYEVSSIEDYAFSGCKILSKVIIPEGVTEIGIAAFSGCNQLKTICLPSTLTRIRSLAFQNTDLDDVYLCASTPPTIDDINAFETIANSVIDLYIPDISIYEHYYNSTFRITLFEPVNEVIIEDFTWPDVGDYGDYTAYTSTPGTHVQEIRYTTRGPVDLTTTPIKQNTSYSILIYVAPCNEGITIASDAPGYLRKSDGSLVECDYVTNLSDGSVCYQFNIYVGERQNDMLIPSVAIEWPEPFVGHDPAADMALHPYQDTTEGCTMSSLLWFVVDENREMEAGETFQEGKAYRLMGLFTADDGYAFSDNTSCTLNGYYPDLFGMFITKDYFAFYHYFVPTNSQPTPITTIEAEPVDSDAWFSLDGRRLPSAPTRSGIYLHKGQKVVVR